MPQAAACSAGKLLAEQRQAEGSRVADEPRQRPRPPGVRDEPELRKRLHEARGARGDDQVAGKRDVGAGARRDPVDGRDHRHRQVLQREHQRLVVPLDRIAEVDRLAAGRHGPVAEILARAKSASGAAEDQYASPHRAERRERVAYLGVHRRVEAVELVRPIERQARDAPVEAEQNGFV